MLVVVGFAMVAERLIAGISIFIGNSALITTGDVTVLALTTEFADTTAVPFEAANTDDVSGKRSS
jgi:hypothetical protein